MVVYVYLWLAGNICCLVGVDLFLVKTVTITTFKHTHNLRVINVSPLFWVLPFNLRPCWSSLAGTVPRSVVILCICIRTLTFVIQVEGLLDRSYSPLKKFDLSYRETVSEGSDQVSFQVQLAPNKHDRLCMKAVPIPGGLPEDYWQGGS